MMLLGHCCPVSTPTVEDSSLGRVGGGGSSAAVREKMAGGKQDCIDIESTENYGAKGKKVRKHKPKR